MVLGLFLVALAFLGCCTAFFGNCLCGCVFGLLAFLISALFVVVGLVMIVVAIKGEDVVTDYCNGVYDD